MTTPVIAGAAATARMAPTRLAGAAVRSLLTVEELSPSRPRAPPATPEDRYPGGGGHGSP